MSKQVVESLKIPASLEDIFYERRARVEEALTALNSSIVNLVENYPEFKELEKQFYRAILYSDFAFDKIVHKTDIFVALLESGAITQARSMEFYQTVLTERCAACQSQEEWMASLRKFREMEMLRYVWREVNQLCCVRDSAFENSAFASSAIDVSLQFLEKKLKQDFGNPRSSVDNSEQSMAVLGMGKLGGAELNLSSDIDLIFFYRDAGKTDGPRSIENQQFFLKLSQQLIRTLDEQTVDGFVFRVDMRLRPYGDSGLLVLNQNAMELYYETQGRTWERYAFVKAAWVAGDRELCEDFLKTLKPFIYRKYVDFTVVESLREMKLLINRQVRSKGLENDIKMGEGGIRELEFIVQALQLIKGGRKPALQVCSYFQAMEAVHKLDLMSQDDKEQLCKHYTFYRRVEHLIQAKADEQSQMLPGDNQAGALLAWVMGYSSYEELHNDVQERRRYVREVFDELFATPEDAANEYNEDEFDQERCVSAWQHVSEQHIDFKLEKSLEIELNDIIKRFSEEKILKGLSENEKKRLDQCMAYLIFKIADFENPAALIEHVISFLRVILRRSAYLVLLSENPTVYDYLLSLFQRSQWVLDNLIQHPFLLDELLQLQNNKDLPSPEDVFDDLRQLSLRMDAHDLETRLEELRVFKCTYEMQAAALYLDRHINTSDLGDFLSALAQALLQEVSRLALNESVTGEDQAVKKQFIQENFSIIAYGKLGSREMGFGSDLDLVFVFDESSVPFEDAGRFLTRYGQKIIHLLSARTYSGILYESDMRLRPSGKSGQMVSSLTAFEKYQHESAWTWEHQALVKARVVVGSEKMHAAFEGIRAGVLAKPRDPAILLKDMLDMQQRLRANSPGASIVDQFHLKSDQGGIVDIEFLAQFLVLSQARDFPDLLHAHATLEVFNFAESEPALKPDWLPALKDSYLFFRRKINELTLAYQKGMLPRESFQEKRDEVASVWQKLIEHYSLEK